jgi:hypothetical protein
LYINGVLTVYMIPTSCAVTSTFSCWLACTLMRAARPDPDPDPVSNV